MPKYERKCKGYKGLYELYESSYVNDTCIFESSPAEERRLIRIQATLDILSRTINFCMKQEFLDAKLEIEQYLSSISQNEPAAIFLRHHLSSFEKIIAQYQEGLCDLSQVKKKLQHLLQETEQNIPSIASKCKNKAASYLPRFLYKTQPAQNPHISLYSSLKKILTEALNFYDVQTIEL